LKKLLAARIWKDYNAGVGFNPPKVMRSKFLVACLLGLILTGGVFAAEVLEKRSRQMPFVEVFGCEGVNAFVFRGPKGTSRRPILVPPREYWSSSEAGIYSFVLRYHSGNVRSRLVTPEVFARYQVGDDFRDSVVVTETSTEDNKSIEPVEHHHHHHHRHAAQLRKRTHTQHVAKHHRAHRAKRIAAR
jgi:hypothetical protein